MPEIQIVSSTTATGIWALQDWIDFTKTKPRERSFKGYGHYFVDYVKDGDGTWRIKKVRLTRLKIDPYTGPPSPADLSPMPEPPVRR
jgi:SnoaL-like domain